MTEDGPFPQILQLVPDLSSCLSDLPLLFFNWVTEVAIKLNDGFHDELTAADDIESGRVLANVVNGCTLAHLELISRIIEIESVFSFPCAKELVHREVFQPDHPLFILVPLQNFLVVTLGQHKCNDICVRHYSRTSCSVIELICDSWLTHDCICSKDSDCPMATILRISRWIVEDIDTAITLVNYVHAVAHIALVHQWIPFFKLLALKFVNEGRN